MLSPLNEGKRSLPSRSHSLIVCLLLALVFIFPVVGYSGEENSGMKFATLIASSNGAADRSVRVGLDTLKPGREERVLHPEEKALLELVNRTRTAHNLPPLRISDPLAAAAICHSRDMAENRFVSHTGSAGTSPSARMLSAGYQYRVSGENVAAGQSTPEAVLKSWMNSPGHRSNLLNSKFCEMGIGYVYQAGTPYRHYWTLDLGTRRN